MTDPTAPVKIKIILGVLVFIFVLSVLSIWYQSNKVQTVKAPYLNAR